MTLPVQKAERAPGGRFEDVNSSPLAEMLIVDSKGRRIQLAAHRLVDDKVIRPSARRGRPHEADT